MAPKTKSVFVCSACGYESPKWLGKCPSCGEWNTMEEELRTAQPAVAKQKSAHSAGPMHSFALNQIEPDNELRYKTEIGELDRVLGGGIVLFALVGLFTGSANPQFCCRLAAPSASRWRSFMFQAKNHTVRSSCAPTVCMLRGRGFVCSARPIFNRSVNIS